MDRKRVFISYSHDAEVSQAHRQRVLGLSERLRADGIETSLDQYVNGSPKQGWPRWMLDQLDAADRVLVVCTETYYRRFRGHEEPGKGKGVDWEGGLITQEIYDARSRTTKFVPVLFDPKDEPSIPEPLRGQTWYLANTKAGYDALYDALLEQAGVEPTKLGTPKVRGRKKATPLTFEEERGDGGTQRVGPVRLSRLPPKLFGREKELERLDAAWLDPKIHVLTLVAWGGEGKTALAGKWAAGLAARNYDGARYFEESFYSQGTSEDRAASSDAFLAAALHFFGDERMAESPAAPEEKGRRLADLVARERTLLLLDGVEPLQYPPGHPLGGEFKDPGLKALLQRLAQGNPGLCLVTTRETVTDLAGFRESTAPEWKLDSLPTPAGAELLRSLGVQGSRAEIEKLVEEVKGHALTLNLVGSYLVRAHGGDVRRRDRIDFQKADKATQGGHAFKAMAAYERWLAEGGEEGARQLAILRLLGLFDRPADAGCLQALRRSPAIPSLTEPLFLREPGWRGWFKKPQPIGDQDWNLAVSALREARLLSPAATAPGGGAPAEGETLDAHPLLREHFARRLREEHPEAWKAGHGRLYEHLRDSTEHQPNTLEGLQPLYQAVAHGCRAGRQQEACDEVYWNRISRGADAYVGRKLGAFGADLGAVASFFETPWSRVSPALTEATQAWLLIQAAYRLRALGRLREALEPMRAGLENLIRHKNWKQAAKAASNLSELELTLGEVPAAARDAEQAVTFADRSGDAFRRMAFRATRAVALHQAGRRDEALELFREAERLQAERQPGYPLLYSLRGFQYCDRLLVEAERAAWRGGGEGPEAQALSKAAREVEERAGKTLEWEEAMPGAPLLDFALHHLSLGRARLYRAILEGSDPNPAGPEIEQAVAGLRHAGATHHVPRGLLTRAWLRALQGNTASAEADLAEAQEIAERGPMPLFLADVHLHRARLFRDHAALASARALIEKHGYWRRKEELEDAEAAALGW